MEKNVEQFKGITALGVTIFLTLCVKVLNTAC